jgi:hypothetical protein
MSLFSLKVIELFVFTPLLDKKGFMINKLNIKKATGFDGISAKMIKLAKPVATGPITSLINKSIETSIFPDQLKVDEKMIKRDENGFQRKKRADQKLFAQKFLKMLEEHLLDDTLFCLADHFCS